VILLNSRTRTTDISTRSSVPHVLTDLVYILLTTHVGLVKTQLKFGVNVSIALLMICFYQLIVLNVWEKESYPNQMVNSNQSISANSRTLLTALSTIPDLKDFVIHVIQPGMNKEISV